MGQEASARPPPPPQHSAIEQKMKAKEWEWQMKQEQKSLDKEIKKIKAGEVKLQKEIQAQAERGNIQAVQMLAQSIVRSRKAAERLEQTKTSMKGVELQLSTTIATMSTTSSLRLSADIMKHMNEISGVPEVGAIMQRMRQEMQMCTDAEDGITEALKTDGEEEAAAAEVQKVLDEMALDQMGPLAAARATLAGAGAEAAPAAAPTTAAPKAEERQLVAEQAIGESAPPKPVAAASAPAAKASEPPAPKEASDDLMQRLAAAAPGVGVPLPQDAGLDDELMRRIAAAAPGAATPAPSPDGIAIQASPPSGNAPPVAPADADEELMKRLAKLKNF